METPKNGFTGITDPGYSNASTLQPFNQSPGLRPLRGGEADYFLFALDGKRALCHRQKSFLEVFLGASNQIAAATQV